MIQAYVIYKETLGSNHSIVHKIREEYMKELRDSLSFSDKILEQRLSAQQAFFKYRHDERQDSQ